MQQEKPVRGTNRTITLTKTSRSQSCSQNQNYPTLVQTFVTGFGKIRLNAANNFFQYHRVKPYGSTFFEKNFMAEMDRHQLALAYDAAVSSGVL